MSITITGVQGIDTTTRYEFGGEAMIIVDADRTFRVTSAEVSADGSVRVILVRRTLKGTDYKNGAGMWLSLDNVRDTEMVDAIVNAIETTNTGDSSYNDTPEETMIHNETPDAPAPVEPTDDLWAQGETRTTTDLRPGDTVEVGRRPGVVPKTTAVVEVEPVEDGAYMIHLEDGGPYTCSDTGKWRVILPARLEVVHGPAGGRERPSGLTVRYRTRKPGHARRRRGAHR